MRLSSDDIQKQEFGVKFFGFDKDEVRVFLKVVATEYEELVNEVEMLKKQLEDRDVQGRLVNETREEIREAEKEVERMRKEIADLKRQYRVFEDRMKRGRRGERL